LQGNAQTHDSKEPEKPLAVITGDITRRLKEFINVNKKLIHVISGKASQMRGVTLVQQSAASGICEQASNRDNISDTVAESRFPFQAARDPIEVAKWLLGLAVQHADSGQRTKVDGRELIKSSHRGGIALAVDPQEIYERVRTGHGLTGVPGKQRLGRPVGHLFIEAFNPRGVDDGDSLENRGIRQPYPDFSNLLGGNRVLRRKHPIGSKKSLTGSAIAQLELDVLRITCLEPRDHPGRLAVTRGSDRRPQQRIDKRGLPHADTPGEGHTKRLAERTHEPGELIIQVLLAEADTHTKSRNTAAQRTLLRNCSRHSGLHTGSSRLDGTATTNSRSSRKTTPHHPVAAGEQAPVMLAGIPSQALPPAPAIVHP
jgi:hypothetical protein